MRYEPTQLPDVDTVEVLILAGSTDRSLAQFLPFTQVFAVRDWERFRVSYSIKLSGDVAHEIAELWRHLPPAGQYKCHQPPFGLRFYAEGILLLEASICWLCNNILIKMNSNDAVYAFNGRHEVSQKLFAKLTEITNRKSGIDEVSQKLLAKITRMIKRKD